MKEIVYKTAVVILLIVFGMIRIPFRIKSKKTQKTSQDSKPLEFILIALTWIGIGLLPAIYAFSGLFNVFSAGINDIVRVTGVIIYLLALIMFYLSHGELTKNWSDTLAIGKGHTLVCSGIYKKIRHPMYASFLLMMAGQFLVVSNWIVGTFGIFAVGLLLIIRIPREEKMMKDEFGQKYIEYMKDTGRILPKF